MAHDIHIPPAALEAGAEAFLECDRSPACSFEDALRAAIAAALNGWPGAEVVGWYHEDHTVIILPLPTEASDE
jgi:hypothetical protein